MEVKLTIVVLIAMTLMVNEVVADFFYNHPSPKAEDIDDFQYKCVPGRTIIKVSEGKIQIISKEKSDSEEYRLRTGPTRKKHMTVPSQNEHCKICVCSAEGKDEYCSNRPAANVNECLVLKDITDKFNMGLPYEHTKNLAYRIRRVNHVGNVQTKKKCVPFISEYTNCNEDNLCTGCKRCLCDSDGEWACENVKECRDDDNSPPDINMKEGDDIFDNALQMLESDVNKKRVNIKVSQNPYVPAPHVRSQQDELLGYLVAIPRQEH